MHRITLIVTFGAAFLLGFLIREVASFPVGQLPDGGEYQGPLVNGRLHGAGEIHWPNGSHYQGEFDHGLQQGRGIYVYANGDRYEGQFLKGYPEGQGLMRYRNGDTYVGQFKAGMLHGQGRYTNGNVIYEGDFTNDEFTGQGSMTEGGTLKYSGSFREWTFNGEGQYFTADNTRWTGHFVDGALQGKGEWTDGEGNRYVGAFEQWQYQGTGIYYFRDQRRYEGEFRNGQMHGEGVMHLAAPEQGVLSYRGRWRNGTLVSADVPAFVEKTDEKLEKALYSEAERLQQQMMQLQPGVKGVPELFFLGVAGDGSQRVFGREIDFITQQLQQAFEIDGHTITLINDRFRIGDASMATRISLEKALKALAANMNLDEDVLLLYVTSHGSKDHQFVLGQKGLDLPDLSAETLAQMLRESGIRYQIVMVSACYSGGFLPLLEGPERLVMTAAAADRNSFGCSDDSDMTYFGKAFFQEAFPVEHDWVKAFEVARQWIEQREKEEKITPSLPQMAVGKRIESKLAQLQRIQTKT